MDAKVVQNDDIHDDVLCHRKCEWKCVPTPLGDAQKKMVKASLDQGVLEAEKILA
jgi:hypothetical protein